MSQIKQLLLLKKSGISNRKAANIIGMNKETVNNYMNKVNADSLNLDELIRLDDPILEHRLKGGNPAYSDKRFETFKALLPYLPGMGSGVLEDIMSIPDSSLRKRLGYEVLSFSLQAHSLSQECIDKLDIFFADDLFKYESVCIAAMEHLKSKATAPIQNGPLPA